MIQNISIQEVMQKNPVTVHPKESLEHAREIFRHMDIHHLPIVVMNKVVGIISLGDLLFIEGMKNKNRDKHLRSFELGFSTLDEIMTLDPICILNSASLKTALSLMIKKRINCLPVVNDENHLMGLVTTHDFNKFLLKNLDTS